jgi:hypothetical protein
MLYRFITGHAFTGEYTQHFFPLHTSDQITCPCSAPIQMIKHILMEYTLHTATHQKYFTVNGCL